MRILNYKKEIETPVLLAHAIEDSTHTFGISGEGGGWTPKPPLGTPLTVIMGVLNTESNSKLKGIVFKFNAYKMIPASAVFIIIIQ